MSRVTVHVPVFLTRFTCLGADCEDTCCKGWNMQVDTLTQERYRQQAPVLLESVTGEGEEAVMRRDPKTDYCVKLEGGLCGIQRQHGEQFLGDACYLYPRATRRLGKRAMMTATLSCPEIARLALWGDNPFTPNTIDAPRLPQSLQDYLPEGLTAEQALGIHQLFLNAALEEGMTAEQSFLRMFAVSQSLARIPTDAWPDAAPFYFQHADASLPKPEPRATDPVYLLQALCGLVAAAKYAHHTRLMQTIADMEKALHVTIRWDTLAIATLPDSEYAAKALLARWRDTWRRQHTTLLKRYLAMQASLALLPFAGFGPSLPERVAIIGIRMATVRLALMSILDTAGSTATANDIVRAVQSISRFLDHLGSPDFSLKIYQETQWLSGSRLAGLFL